MSTPTKLLLGSVAVFFALVVADLDIDAIVEERPVVTFLLRAVVILCIAGAATAVVWWPFNFRARRRQKKLDRQAAIQAQAAVDWVVTVGGTVDGVAARGLVDRDTGAERWLVKLTSNSGPEPAIGTHVAVIGDAGSAVNVVRRAALESEDDQDADEASWFARDLLPVETFDGGADQPSWPTA